MTPHASASAPAPNRSTSPITNSEIAQPTTSRIATIGTRPKPSDDVSKLKNTSAPSTITPTPIPSFTNPNRATPAMNSTSRNGVTIRLRMLRLQVSSSMPVLSAICDW
jgi:hypothetical protein